MTKQQIKANARLIAAATQLLEAAKDIEKLVLGGGIVVTRPELRTCFKRLYGSIAKAEGILCASQLSE